MMCADFRNLEREVRALEKAGSDLFHIDVMDGVYTPNLTLGLQDIKAIRSLTSLPLDAHLMMVNPGDKIDWFIKAGCDIIYIHPKADAFPTKTLLKIKEAGVHPGIAINPEESVESVREMLPLCDDLLIMSVHPGFAGQKFLDFVEPKIKELVKLKSTYGYTIFLDGNCTPTVIEKYANIGVDGFVLGTSALFRDGLSYQEALAGLR